TRRMISSTSRGAGITIVPVTRQRSAIVGMIGSTRGRPWSSASFSRNDFFVFMSSPSAFSGRTTQRIRPLFPRRRYAPRYAVSHPSLVHRGTPMTPLQRAELSLEGLSIGDAFGQQFFGKPDIMLALIER